MKPRNYVRKAALGLTVLAGLALPGAAFANVLTTFNAGQLITDFNFNDAAGTTIENTVNDANLLQPFDTDADFGGAVTNGLGQFDASGKANTDFGSVYSDIDPINSGRVIALFDVAWAFNENIYDPAQDEEFRLSLITFDPRSTFVTAEIFFQRTAADEVVLFGNGVGTGATDTPDFFFGPIGDALVMLDLNLDTSMFELSFSLDDGLNFTSVGTGLTDPSRGIDSFRFVLNEDFSDDTLLIERMALAQIVDGAVPIPAMAIPFAMAAFGVFGVRRRR